MKAQAIFKSSQNVIILDMAKQGQQQPIDISKIKLSVPDGVKAGVYANTLSGVATNTEITLDFTYMNASDGAPTGTVVSRVIIPPTFAKNIIDSLTKLIEIQEKAEK